MLLAQVAWSGAGTRHFDLQATFVPATGAKGDAAVAVLFTAKDPDVKINEIPAPKLKLDAAQSVLQSNAEAPKAAGFEAPDQTRYLDLAAPLRFPVALGSAATKGTHLVKGSVAYFYCSKREGWCRKGTTEVEIPVLLK
jgi:hypothetical protein